MKAVMCTEWGGPEKLIVGEAPEPELGSGEVRIAVKACGVNFGDTLLIQGSYQVKPDFPFVPGMEAAGDVLEVGDGVTGIKSGDRVVASTSLGAYAEQAVCKAASVVALPNKMDYVTAASFPVAYGTSHVGLDYRAGLKEGETLLVTGAAGGVGLTAVEIGAQMGARVIAAASSPEKLAVCAARGAAELIDYSKEDLRQRVKELTDGRGADVVYDPVGGEAFDAAMRSIAWEGRIVIIGFASGQWNQVKTNIVMVKNVSVIGFYWGSYAIHKPEIAGRSMRQLVDWYEAGRLDPHVSHTLPLDEVAQALDLIISRKSTGKVVIEVS